MFFDLTKGKSVWLIALTLNNDEILALLDRFKDYLTQGFLLWEILRPFGMIIAKGLSWVLDGISGVMTNLITLLDVVDNSNFQLLVNKVEPIKWGLLLLFVIGFFVLLMFNKVNNASQAPLNLFMLICMTMMLPFFFSTFSTMVQGIHEGIGTDFSKPGTAIIFENTTDLALVAEEGWTLPEGETKNNYKKIEQIDMTEKISDPSKISNGEVLKQKIVTDVSGNDQLEEIKKPGKAAELINENFFSTFYYRNKVRFFHIYLTQIVSIIAIGFSSFKFAIVINKMYGDYVLLITGGIADFASMQRAKALFSELAGTFALIVYVPILIQIYLISVAIIKSMNFDFFTYIIAMAGAAWALIDGPNGFARITGIDAGLKSTAAVVAGALGGSKLVNKMKDAGASVTKSAGSLLTEAGAFGLGMAMEGLNSHGMNTPINSEDPGEDDSTQMNDSEDNEDSKDREDGKGLGDPYNPEDQNNKNTLEDPENSDDKGEQQDNQREEPGLNNEEENNNSGEDSNDSNINRDNDSAEDSHDRDDLNSLSSEEPPEDTENDDASDIRKTSGHGDQSNGVNRDFTGEQDENRDMNPPDTTLPMNSEESIGEGDETHVGPSSEPEIPSEPNVKPTELRKQYDELGKSNPLRQEMKNKVFGFSPEDRRRYYKQTSLEKTQDKYSAGKEYQKYRQQRKEIRKKMKDKDKEK